MSQTIKDQIHFQVLLNQRLLNYNESDSSESDSQRKSQNQNMPLKAKSQTQSSTIFYSHQQMNQKRREVLKQLPNGSNTNHTKDTKNHQKPHKVVKLGQRSSENDNKTIVELKSKLAQVLKESHEKSVKINQIKNSLFQVSQKIQKLESSLNEKSNIITQKDELIQKLSFQNRKLQQEYNARISQLEEQLSKNQQVQLSKFSEKELTKINERKVLNQLKIQIQLKNEEIAELKKNQEKGRKIKIQNKKLKMDVEKLLSLLEKCHKSQPQQQKKNKKAGQKCFSSNMRKKRSVSLGQENLIENKKSDLSSIKYSPSTKKEEGNKSFTSIKETTLITEPSFFLTSEVSKFLKKWHVAQNNHKFVESLVRLIHEFTQTCIEKHRHKVQSQYKSLKKEMIRKANQSLNFHQVMKERQIQIKLNKSLNGQSQKKNFTKVQQQFNNTKDRTLSSDNLSILVPASNKKRQPENRNSKLLSASLLEDKQIQKQDICYNNLQQSIRLHQKMSNNQATQKIHSNSSIDQKIKVIFQQQSARKQHHRKTKTQISNSIHSNFLKSDFSLENRKLI